MPTRTTSARAEHVFRAVIRRRRLALFLGLLFILATGLGLSRLHKDPNTDSLIPPDHPSMAAVERAEYLFGLRDPVVVAIVAEGPSGVFTPDGLVSVMRLHEAVAGLDNVRPDRVISIASESRIYGDGDALLVEDFLTSAPETQAEADAVRAAVMASPLHKGRLVSEDGRGVLIVAELYDRDLAEETYLQALELSRAVELEGHRTFVAGQGAVTGHLSASIDRDSRKLPAICVVVIFVLIFAAFRRLGALAAPLLIVAATVAGAVGLMSWLGISYYVITSALPIMLTAIAVADSIHILSGYYSRRAALPAEPVEEAIIGVMVDLWRPLTLTSLTTIAGFAGIAMASVMPPMLYFAWFAAFGIFVAWAFSLFVLPGVMAMMKLKPSPMVRGDGGVLGAGLTRLAQACAVRPAVSLGLVAAISVVAATYATQVRIDNASIDNFRPDTEIHRADAAMNETFAGTAYLDVIVSADAPEGLLDAEHMSRILDLQAFLEDQPFVRESHSVAEVLVELHGALEPGAGAALPGSDDAVAQYLLLYESAGDPTNLEDEIDHDYQNALVRAYLNAHLVSESRPAVLALERYLEEEFNTAGLTGTISGRVNVNHHWTAKLAKGHGRSILISLALVVLVAALLFRSALFGLLSVVPVLASILGVYGVMGARGIFIEPGTYMFAAISIGVGVDFAIHFLDRLRQGVEGEGLSLHDAIARYYPTSARACALNATALGLGFSILMVSQLPPIFKFGMLISVAAFASFLAGLVVTAAAYALMRKRVQAPAMASRLSALVGLSLMAALIGSGEARADTDGAQLTGREIAERLDARDRGKTSQRTIRMELIDRRGRVRERAARALRIEEEGLTRSAIYFISPRRLRDTAFLSHDRAERGAEDLRWLYLPVSGRPKQIPASERGSYFLGTDFTYSDISSDLTFDLEDYEFERLPSAPEDPTGSVRLQATPKSADIAQELGVGRIEAVVDTTSWTPLHIAVEDPRGRPLKVVEVSGLRQVGGIWTPRKIAAHHLQNEHRTIFTYEDVAYGLDVAEDVLTPQGLRRGPR